MSILSILPPGTRVHFDEMGEDGPRYRKRTAKIISYNIVSREYRVKTDEGLDEIWSRWDTFKALDES